MSLTEAASRAREIAADERRDGAADVHDKNRTRKKHDGDTQEDFQREGSSSQGSLSQDGCIDREDYPWSDRNRQRCRSIPRVARP